MHDQSKNLEYTTVLPKVVEVWMKESTSVGRPLFLPKGRGAIGLVSGRDWGHRTQPDTRVDPIPCTTRPGVSGETGGRPRRHMTFPTF